jgi:ParB family chromosome partitioning protein
VATSTTFDLALSAIVVGDRFRRDLGDIEALAGSIERLGLLQPIGVTPEHRLVFGRRRLEVFRYLGRTTIPARVVDVPSIMAGEYAENEMRKAFTVSERVAIGEAVERELGNRQGRRTDRLPGEVPEVPRGTETRRAAAERAGFGNETTYRQAKALVAEAPDLAAHVDAGGRSVGGAWLELTKRKRPHVVHNSGDHEWYTPEEYVRAARLVLGGIDLDPASTAVANEVVGAARFFTAEADGLAQEWNGRVWLNPPYASDLVGRFAEKLAASFEAGLVPAALVLVNNATETRWFQRLLSVASAVCFPLGRVKFWHPRKVATPLQGQAVLCLGPAADAFISEFSRFGAMARVAR